MEHSLVTISFHWLDSMLSLLDFKHYFFFWTKHSMVLHVFFSCLPHVLFTATPMQRSPLCAFGCCFLACMLLPHTLHVVLTLVTSSPHPFPLSCFSPLAPSFALAHSFSSPPLSVFLPSPSMLLTSYSGPLLGAPTKLLNRHHTALFFFTLIFSHTAQQG